MKNNLTKIRQIVWQIFCEVPGWPDAPRRMNLRRALPFLVPFSACVLLAAWNYLFSFPHIKAEQEANRPLQALEDEIAAYRLNASDQQVSELAARAAAVSRLLVEDPSGLTPILQSLKQAASDLRWEANFIAGDPTEAPPGEDARLRFLPVRGKLVCAAGDPDAYSSLLSLLARFSSDEKRIDLTHLVIRVDEQGRYSAEISFRLACQLTHEKTLQ